jgi:hypothetical protein
MTWIPPLPKIGGDNGPEAVEKKKKKHRRERET